MSVVNETAVSLSSIPMNRTRGVDSARRVLQILLQFSESKPEISVEEVARVHDISIPSAYRYVALLRELYLVEERNRGTYVLSPQVLRLTSAAEASLDIGRVAQPMVDRLVGQIGETVLVLRRIRDAAVCVASSQPDLTLSLSFRPGHMMPLHRGAAAKVLLAASPASKRDLYLDKLEPSMPTAQRKAFVQELSRISSEGIAESDSEVDDGIWAVAAPIVVGGTVVASVSVAGPSFRSNEKTRAKLRLVVRGAAAEIGESLAGGPALRRD